MPLSEEALTKFHLGNSHDYTVYMGSASEQHTTRFPDCPWKFVDQEEEDEIGTLYVGMDGAAYRLVDLGILHRDGKPLYRRSHMGDKPGSAWVSELPPSAIVWSPSKGLI